MLLYPTLFNEKKWKSWVNQQEVICGYIVFFLFYQKKVLNSTHHGVLQKTLLNKHLENNMMISKVDASA